MPCPCPCPCRWPDVPTLFLAAAAGPETGYTSSLVCRSMTVCVYCALPCADPAPLPNSATGQVGCRWFLIACPDACRWLVIIQSTTQAATCWHIPTAHSDWGRDVLTMFVRAMSLLGLRSRMVVRELRWVFGLGLRPHSWLGELRGQLSQTLQSPRV